MNDIKRFHLIILLFCINTLCSQYQTIRIGSNTDKQISQVQFGVMIAGGASDNDESMRWMLSRVVGGDVLVLRSSGGDAYNKYLYEELGVAVNSVETIIFQDQSASFDPYVLQRLAEAEMVFFAGGNQAKYLEYFRNTPLENILQDKIDKRNIVIGGTSAGAMILGSAYFTAENGTVYSDEALKNPFNQYMTLGSDNFLKIPFLENTIIDTHFDNPDRRGRLVGFLARLFHSTGKAHRGIGIDEYTAVAFDQNGMVRIFGEFPVYDDKVYFFRSNCYEPVMPEVIQAGIPLSWSELFMAEVKAFSMDTNSFDLNALDQLPDVASEFFKIEVVNGEMSVEKIFQNRFCQPSHIKKPETQRSRIRISKLSPDLYFIHSSKTMKSISIFTPDGREVRSFPVEMSTDAVLNLDQLTDGLYYVLIVYKDNSVDAAIFDIF